MDRRNVLSMLSIGAGMSLVGHPVEAQTTSQSCCVSVKDYGAVGDGSTDDTTAIQNALDANSDIYFPTGNYVVSSTLTVPSFRRLEGGPNAVIWVASGGLVDVLKVPVDSSNVVFRGINVNGNGSGTANAFHIYGSMVWLETCTTFGLNYGLVSEGPLLFVSNCYFRGNNGVWLLDHTAEVRGFINTVCSVNMGTSGNPFKISGVAGLRVTGCDLMGGSSALLVQPGQGQFATAMEFVNTYFDQGSQVSALFDSTTGGYVQRAKLTNCWATGSASGHGLRLLGSNTQGVQINNCNMYGNALSGISIEANGCIVNGCSIAGNGQSGVSVNSGVGDFVISNNIIGPYGGFGSNVFGIYINSGNGGNFAVTGNVLTGNKSAPLVNASTGANMIIANNAGV